MKGNVESFKILKFFMIFIEEIIFSLSFKYFFGIEKYFCQKIFWVSFLIDVVICIVIVLFSKNIEIIIKIIGFLKEHNYETIFTLFITLVPLSIFFIIAFPRIFFVMWSLLITIIPFFPIYIAGIIQIKFSENLKTLYNSKKYLFFLISLFAIVFLFYLFLLRRIIYVAFQFISFFIIIPLVEYFLTDSKKLFESMYDKKDKSVLKEENDEKNFNNKNEEGKKLLGEE